MTYVKFAAVAVLAAWAVGPARAAEVGVSVSISQPGVYGRIDIGRFPQPQVVYRTPIIVTPPPRVVVRAEPVYMWVPPGHRMNWRRYCRDYGACGVPVAFVQDDWYDAHVRGHGDDRHGHDDDQGHGRGGRDKGKGRGH